MALPSSISSAQRFAFCPTIALTQLQPKFLAINSTILDVAELESELLAMNSNQDLVDSPQDPSI